MNINEYHRWVRDGCENTKRLDYELNKNSIVFDIGGYHGSWSEQIYNKYGSKMYIFEPVDSFYNLIIEKFNKNDNFKIYNFGFCDKNKQTLISLDGDSSGVFDVKDKSQEIELRDISEFLIENNINYIDLMKINIEGGEYDLLTNLLEKNQIKK